MSETDDTDDLLLIPPDFFTVPEDLEHPYYDIVDSLIHQVNHLQSRIETIESTSDISLVSSFIDNSLDYLHNMSNVKKFSSSEDLYQLHSAQSTPQKPHLKVKLRSLPASPNVDRNLARSPRKASPSKEGQSLREIDKFLSNVKKISTSRRLESEFNGAEQKTKKDEQNVNDIMDELDRQSHKIEQRLRGNEKETIEEPKATKLNTWRCGDNIESVPNYDMGFREQLYRNNNLPEKQPRSISLNQNSPEFGSSFNADKSSDSSSDSTQMTAYNRHKYQARDKLSQSPIHFNALNVLDMHKKLLNTSLSPNEPNAKPRGINTITDNSLGFMSLADIWGNNKEFYSQSAKNLNQKLQEEKLRRQHCEHLIQDLQNRNLELQQKMSVAVKVDDSKNNAIKQFQEALEKAATRMERINKEKSSWEVELNKIKKKYTLELEELNKKAAYYEKEASKALNLAHGNQEKMSFLESRCKELQNKIDILEKQIKFVDENYLREAEKNKQLSDILGQKEIELNENKNVLSHARAEVAQSKKAVEICQSEFSSLKNENDKLAEDLRDQKNIVIKLNEQKRMLGNEVEALRNKEKNLQEELKKTKKSMESSNVELKNYYQGQLEVLVQNKLKEFQSELDSAENRFKEEIKKREMSIAKTAATHIQQISEKYSLEIKLLEEKHHEETRLFKIQIMQHRQEVESLQNKLDSTREKSAQLEKQLKKFMEYQWNEALKIFTNNKSPTPIPGDNFTIDQLNALKSQSYQNLEEVLSQHNYDGLNFKKSKSEEQKIDEKLADTPVSSRQQKLGESEIQKYINLLLNREPGNPTTENQNQGANGENPNWQPSIESIYRQRNNGDSRMGTRKFGKPPWK